MPVKPFRLKVLTSALAVIAVSGCASTPPPQIGAADTTPVSELGQDGFNFARSTVYALRAADKISVSVFREPDLSIEDVRVGVEGNVSLPLLGSIPAAGLTAKQFEQDVTRRLSAVGVKAPMVSVNITDYASNLVTVEGQVKKPGVFPFQPGTRLSAAVAMAEGPTQIAKRQQLVVFRESPEGIRVAVFDHVLMSQGTMLDPVLEPGDRVVMGTNGLSAFWQDLIKTLPAFGAFILVGAR
jgi:polysaccharide export outer membrane protein